MLGLIFVLILVLLGVLIAHVVSNISDNVKAIESLGHCKLHDWWEVQDEQGNDLGLICIVCGKKPQEMQ